MNCAVQVADLKGGRNSPCDAVELAKIRAGVDSSYPLQVCRTTKTWEIIDVMSNIDELQRRITAAMDRVAAGLAEISSGQAAADPDMAQALEDERTANAQLTERVRALKTKSDAEMASLRTQVEESQGRMAQLDVELQRVRRANAALADACTALRDANEEGVGDPHLINKTMLAELEALRAARAADVAESSAILAALTPLVDAAAGPEGRDKQEKPDA
jgi:predicted  nucleic acid-binding Zn-ribbon protein